MSEQDRNLGTDFDVCRRLWYPSDNVAININMPAVDRNASNLSKRIGKERNGQIASLLRAVTCMDLTSLSGDDTMSNILCLCHKAEHPIKEYFLDNLKINPERIHVATVCVYPARIADCVKTLKGLGSMVPVTAVAAGFPSGQYHLDSKLEEIKGCIKEGAKEIDIVISRDLVLLGEWERLYEEVKSFREVCGKDVCLKTIIAAGELGSLDNVYRASVVCMGAGISPISILLIKCSENNASSLSLLINMLICGALLLILRFNLECQPSTGLFVRCLCLYTFHTSTGADFIKTSTGKESVNATLPVGMTMTRAIKNYFLETGLKVGFKPAGGIRIANDVLLWQALMKRELGSEWLHPSLFRIGASSLLSDIEAGIFQHLWGYPEFRFQ